MDDDVFVKVRDDILTAEEQYSIASKEAKGIYAVSKAIETMKAIKMDKIDCSEDATGITNLLSATEEKFRRTLKSLQDDGRSPTQAVIDFSDWAHELQCALRLHDFMQLSIDSSEDESEGSNFDAENRKGEKSTASKLFWSVNAFDKHGAEELQFLESTDGKAFRHYNRVTIFAWFFVLICMLATLAVLTKDFIHSQLNPGIRVEQVIATELSAPAITVCNPTAGTPSFLNFPTKQHPGHPLFGISHVKNMHGGLSKNVFHNNDGISNVLVPIPKGPSASKCKKELSTMSISRGREGLFSYEIEKNNSLIGVPKLDSKPCFQCFTFGGKVGQKLSETKFWSPRYMPLSLDVFSSRPLSYCQQKYDWSTRQLQTYFDQELTAHLQNLTAAGILQIPDNLSESEKKVLFKESLYFTERSLREFLCSVYFFAGYFYPSDDEGEVKYKWSSSEKKWTPLPGSKTFLIGTMGNSSYPYTFGPGKMSKKNLEFSIGMEINFEDPKKAIIRNDVLPLNTASSFISGPSVTIVYFNRRDEGERGLIYDAEITTNAVKPSDVRVSRYFHWTVGFDYKGFTTTKRSTQPSMSWPEFMTDIFEYIGLFTGVCIFSMIVAPSQALV